MSIDISFMLLEGDVVTRDNVEVIGYVFQAMEEYIRYLERRLLEEEAKAKK